jgi:hypothetical protein
MFTVLAIIFTVLAAFMVPHGGPTRYTPISHIGCACGIIALILWAVVTISLIWWTIAWLWVHAP